MKKICFPIFSLIIVLLCGLALISPSVFNTSYAELIIIGEPIHINSTNRFVEVFTTEAVYNNSDVEIVLTNDLDFTDVDLSDISALGGNFKGTFDGNGWTISNLKLSSSSQYFGLIPYATNAIIKNVRISKNVEFEFNSLNIYELYAGVLVGYAENVVFENCEFDNTLGVDDKGNTTYASVNLPVYSNLNFGALAGKVKGNPNAVNNLPNIKNCVNYYDYLVEINKDVTLNIGGLVGTCENGYMLNTLNFGSMTITSNLDTASTQLVGGIVGAINGTGINVRNSCFGGSLNVDGAGTSQNLLKGAILGGSLSNQPNAVNINFDYYTDISLLPSGDNYVENGDKIYRISAINESFLKNEENFDMAQQSTWDFVRVWKLYNSRFHIQNFLTFDFSFRTPTDNGQILSSAVIDSDLTSVTKRFGENVTLKLAIKPQYQGYYTLSKSGILVDSLPFEGEAEIKSETDENDKIIGYQIVVQAYAKTSGSYSFTLSQEKFECEVTISENAKTQKEGGVRVVDLGSVTDLTEHMTIYFTYSKRIQTIEGEGKDIYSFDHWELYYRDSDGSYTVETLFDQRYDSRLTINFDESPFNREFKLVAFFTDESAIKVGFGNINENSTISSIVFNGKTYSGEPILTSPKSTQTLEITVKNGYFLDIEKLTSDIQKLYNNDQITIPYYVEEGENEETLYRVTINMSYINNLQSNDLNIALTVIEDQTNKGDNLLWLYITAPIVGVILIAVIVIIIIRRRGGGGKGGSAKAPKVKTKKVSYKDFY